MVNFLKLLSAFIFVLLSCSSTADSNLAFPGYTGLLNIPSAETTRQGTANISYSDQIFINRSFQHNNNLSAMIGILPFIEVGGRMSWDTTHRNCFATDCGDLRDLSANVKAKIPGLPEAFPDIAFGIQDLGGESNFFDATYLVIGKQFYPRKLGSFRLDVGYGKSEPEKVAGERYLDGPFAGVRYQPVEWFALSTEYDAVNVNLGAQLSTPKNWLPGGISVFAKTLLLDNREGDQKHFFSAGLSIPLGGSAQSGKSKHPGNHPYRGALNVGEQSVSSGVPEKQVSDDDVSHRHEHPGARISGSSQGSVKLNEYSETPANADQKHLSTHSLESLEDRLVHQLVNSGFSDIRLGYRSNELIIQFENDIYNRNEWLALDKALAVVMGEIEKTRNDAQANSVVIVLTNQGLPVIEQALVWSGYTGAIHIKVRAARFSHLKSDAVHWEVLSDNSSRFKPRFTFSPALTSGIATEVGVWDYSLALDSNLAVNLADGLLANISWNEPLDESEDFERGGVFFADRQQSGVREFELQKTFKVAKGLYSAFHAGRYVFDYNGAFNQTLLLSNSGAHAAGFNIGYFEDQANDERSQLIGSYRFHYLPWQMSLKLQAGRFFQQDIGYRADARFWFNDYSIDLIFKDTDARFVGIGFTVPLTPVRDYDFRYFQVRGKENWNYGIQTMIDNPQNLVQIGSAFVMSSNYPIERLYLNNDRFIMGNSEFYHRANH